MKRDDLPPPRELTNDDIEQVFRTIDIPACPAFATEAMKEAQKDMPDINRLARTISADVGMAAITLKLANSPMFRASAPVTTVRKALDRLGIDNVVSVIVTAALKASLKGPSSVFIDRFWSRTSATSMAAALIARRQYGISPDAAYTYALFHDAGIPMMLVRFPEYEKVLAVCHTTGQLVVDTERDYFPCTHAVIGSLLVRNWGLPDTLNLAVRFHHDPDVYDLPDSTIPGSSVSLIATVHVAEHVISGIVGEKDVEVGDPLFERAVSYLGIAQEDLEQIREDVIVALEESRR